jgi:hypothetical protein
MKLDPVDYLRRNQELNEALLGFGLLLIFVVALKVLGGKHPVCALL